MTLRAPDRVGVFGGTFDPVHSGHVAVAEAARDALRLARVELVPALHPPHRPDHQAEAAWHRWTMTVLACDGRVGLYASDREIRRGGVSYTLDTLRSYRTNDPPVAPVLLLGVDAFADLPSWRQPEELVSEFDIAVLTRPGCEFSSVAGALPEWLRRRIVDAGRLAGEEPGPAGGRIALVPVPACPVSATEVRRRLRQGGSVETLVPRAVAEYIEKYQLYGG